MANERGSSEKKELDLQICRLAVDHQYFLATTIPISEHLQPFTNPIRRIANHSVQKSTRPKRAVSQVGDEAIEIAVQQAILPKIGGDIHALLPAQHPSIDIGAHADGAEMRTCDGETPRTDKRIIKDLSRAREGEVGGQEGEFRVHGGCADVAAPFEAVVPHGLSLGIGDPAAEMDPVRVERGEGVFFKYAEAFLGVRHGDGAQEVEIGECFNHLPLRVRRSRALESIKIETE